MLKYTNDAVTDRYRTGRRIFKAQRELSPENHLKQVDPNPYSDVDTHKIL